MERIENMENSREIESDTISERDPDDDLDYEIEDDYTKSFLILSNFEGSPPCLHFSYDYDTEQEKLKNNSSDINMKKSDMKNRVLKEINWETKGMKKFCVLFKTYKNAPLCITAPMKKSGVIRTKSFINANIIWKLMKQDKMSILIKKLNPYQRFNHFPCTWQLGRKDNLWKNFSIMQMQFPEDYDYVPETYLLPDDNEKMLKAVKGDGQAITQQWLIKPVASSRGRGVRLLSNIDTIPKKCIITKYIDNPNVINNKKYDLRLYVLITGHSPLKIYLYDEGLVRFASEEYNNDDKNKHNRYMHLTNYSVNKCSQNYDKNVSTENECMGSKWSISALQAHFKEQGNDFDSTWEKIKDIVIKSIISISEETNDYILKLTKNKNCLFELYGFDILIDSNLKPWLLEINLNPSLNCDTPLDMKIKSNLMNEIFSIVGVQPYSHIKHYKGKNPKLINEEIEISDKNCNNMEVETRTESDNNKEDDTDLIHYSVDEFSRTQHFKRIFPNVENIDYYSKFLAENEDNMLLWKYLKNNK